MARSRNYGIFIDVRADLGRLAFTNVNRVMYLEKLTKNSRCFIRMKRNLTVI